MALAKTKPSEPVKVFLHDRGTDVESVWAEPCGSSARKPLYRLVNIPFLHAKPTWGDVLLAPHSRDYGHPAWDRAGIPFAKVGTRIHADGGRYAAIVDYRHAPRADFQKLCDALWKKHQVQTEGAWGPKDREPGRLYLAVPATLDLATLLDDLGQLEGWSFTLVHPKLVKTRAAKVARAKRPARAKAKPAKATKKATKKPASVKKRPAAAKTRAATPVKRAAAKKAAKRPAAKKKPSKKPSKKPKARR